MTPALHIAFAVDAEYVRPLQVLWDSLFSSHPTGTLHLHVVHTGLAPRAGHGLRRAALRHGATCALYEIPASRVRDLPVNRRFSSPTPYCRWFIPEYLPAEIHRVLYVDSDTLVCRNLTPLFQSDLQERPVAAVEDLDAANSIPRLGLPPSAGYLNSGVLLMDTDRWRQLDVAGSVSRDCAQARYNPAQWKYPDQDGLNLLLQGNWARLAPEWNCYACLRLHQPNDLSPAQRAAVTNPGIIHFTGPEKPWIAPHAPPYQNLYRHHTRQAGIRFPRPLSIRLLLEHHRLRKRLVIQRMIHRQAGLPDNF